MGSNHFLCSSLKISSISNCFLLDFVPASVLAARLGVLVPAAPSPQGLPHQPLPKQRPQNLSHPAGHPEPDPTPASVPPPRSKTPTQPLLPNCRPSWAADKQILSQLRWKPSAARQGAGGALGTLGPGRHPKSLGAGRSTVPASGLRHPTAPGGHPAAGCPPNPLRARRHSHQPAPLARCHLELALK